MLSRSTSPGFGLCTWANLFGIFDVYLEPKVQALRVWAAIRLNVTLAADYSRYVIRSWVSTLEGHYEQIQCLFSKQAQNILHSIHSPNNLEWSTTDKLKSALAGILDPTQPDYSWKNFLCPSYDPSDTQDLIRIPAHDRAKKGSLFQFVTGVASSAAIYRMVMPNERAVSQRGMPR